MYFITHIRSPFLVISHLPHPHPLNPAIGGIRFRALSCSVPSGEGNPHALGVILPLQGGPVLSEAEGSGGGWGVTLHGAHSFPHSWMHKVTEGES